MEVSVDFLLETARHAGGIIHGYFRTIKTATEKAVRGDVVTQADLESEKYIIGRIREAYPEHNILAEESGEISLPKGEYSWIIDPLDGTKNYFQRVPLFCVSIGVLRGGQPFAGAIYDPIHDEMFHAVKGQGAFLNGKPIKVSTQDDLSVIMINLAWSMHRSGGQEFGRYANEIIARTSYSRRYGTAALAMAYVADGRLDAVALIELNPWDTAAGTLIIQEAGGVVSDLKGNPLDFSQKSIHVLGANPAIHEQLMREIFLK